MVYTKHEAAKKLRISSRTLVNLIRRGRLAASNVGTDARPNYRITEASIEKFLEDSKIVTNTRKKKVRSNKSPINHLA